MQVSYAAVMQQQYEYANKYYFIPVTQTSLLASYNIHVEIGWMIDVLKNYYQKALLHLYRMKKMLLFGMRNPN